MASPLDLFHKYKEIFTCDYIPKGSQCRACKKCFDDCSSLDFSKMKKLEKSGSTTIVICSEFQRV